LTQARAGDDDGFLVLWREFQPRLLRYLRVRSPGNESAEDIAGETWLHVVRDLRAFKGDVDDFRAWLFTVARHRSIDAARAAAARPVATSADVEIALDQRRAEPSAEAAALEQISTQQALALVASLPSEQAEMIALRVIAGLDVDAVAQIVGKSRGAVRVSVHRGLRLLAERRSPDNPDPPAADARSLIHDDERAEVRTNATPW